MKILFWDVETSPLLVTSWTLFKPRLSHENIVKDSTLICAAWKTLGNNKIETAAVSAKTPNNDYKAVKRIREALADADVLVAHNGDQFDLKRLNARLIFHGLKPLPPIKTIDTLKVARKHFKFTSSRLDYLGAFLGVGRKIHTEYGMWLDILLRHDKKSLNRMVEYNKQDVKLLEDVYLKLRPFMDNHPNQRLTDGNVCPICQAKDSLQKRGFKLTRTSKFRSYQCQECGGWSRGQVIERTKIS